MRVTLIEFIEHTSVRADLQRWKSTPKTLDSLCKHKINLLSIFYLLFLFRRVWLYNSCSFSTVCWTPAVYFSKELLLSYILLTTSYLVLKHVSFTNQCGESLLEHSASAQERFYTLRSTWTCMFLDGERQTGSTWRKPTEAQGKHSHPHRKTQSDPGVEPRSFLLWGEDLSMRSVYQQ